MAGEVSVIRVPIRVDGLYVEEAYELGLPMADFTRLPYHLANGSTVNPRTPNLAEAAFNATLGRDDGIHGNGLVFPKGLHLHWALPDALTTGRHRGDRTKFPAVPNRWLVRRSDKNGQKSWIVESDFLHACDDNGYPTYDPSEAWPGGKPITYPTTRLQLANKKPGAAFRYMGRSLSLADWLKGVGGDYLNQPANSPYPLTAIGYGEPAFAAYYPNCYSVFGFCDVEAEADTSYEYQVIGWFNETSLDPLDPLHSDFAGLDKDAAYAALENEYGWHVADKKDFPIRTVCYASLKLVPRQVTPWQAAGKVDIAIGNTGGEALAALLADKVAAHTSGDKAVIEDQLEAMNLAPALQGVEVDYQAHFAQTRHQRGFRGIAGGLRWAVLPIPTHHVTAADWDHVPQPPLPDAVAHALDALNDAQEAYDRAQQEIVELRYQVFCDWHKFHVACYTDAVDLAPFRHQSDDLAKFIESQDLKLLDQKIALAGSLVVTKDVVRKDTGEDVVVLARADEHGSNPASLDLRTQDFKLAKPEATTLAVQVVLRLKALLDLLDIEAVFETLFEAKFTTQFEINTRPADHFWRPRDPVVLLSGAPAVATPRHGQDGKLDCTVLAMPAPGTAEFMQKVDALKLGEAAAQSTPPWHPIVLEWSVLVKPADIDTGFKLHDDVPEVSLDASVVERLATAVTTTNIYEGRCLMNPSASAQLDANLRIFLARTTLDDCRDRSTRGTDGESEYVERLIKWYQAKHDAQEPTEKDKKGPWLKQQKPFVDEKQAKDEHGNPRLLSVDAICAWYVDKPVGGGADNTVKNLSPSQQAQDPIYSAMRALSQLGTDRQAPDRMQVLSQALGGFNAALMTRKQVLQIPIEDPLGATGELTARVAKAVGRHHPFAPLSDTVLSPVRSGRLTLAGLRLIDTFGQQRNAPPKAPVPSNGLRGPKDPKAIYLPPRFASPARLNFRWLAAISGQAGVDEVEMNSAPATTPVCGWVLPNHFDKSLMVYDNTGHALGSINTLAEWTPAPGPRDRIAAGAIVNPHLRRLVARLVVHAGTSPDEATKRQQFLRSFLDALDRALEAIEPASSAQHEALALLIGRPIAVVRARVDLQLLGQPMVAETPDDPTIAGRKAIRLTKSRNWNAFVDQDWTVFAEDWGRFYGCSLDDVMNESCTFLGPPADGYARTTGGVEKVVIPMRLGEHHLLNDGLVGFWKETAEGELDNVFYVPQTLDRLTMAAGLQGYTSETEHNLSLTLRDEPLGLTMLMDPRGVVHATSGVLPVSKLEIPSAYYADVLKRMKVTFRVGPIITDSEQLHAAVPKEPGHEWSWVARRDGSSWDETKNKDIVDATEHAHFFSPPKIVEGWLKLTPKKDE